MREPLILLPICLALLGLLGCSKSDPVVARANGHDIKQSELEAFIKLKRPSATTPEAKADALDGYVSRVALAGAIQSESEASAAITQAEIDDFKTNTIISRHFKKLADAKLTEQVVEDYYRTHSSDFTQQNAHVAHIFFRVDQAMTAEQRKEKNAAAKTAFSELQAGKNFAELAATTSEDTTTNQSGGDLGWLNAGNSAPQMLKRAQMMKPQEVAEPIRTSTGYHVVKLLEPLQNVTKPLETVRAEIRQRLQNDMRTAETQRLMAKAKVEINGKPRTETTQAAASDSRRADR